MTRELNWAGNYGYGAATIHLPASLSEVQSAVVASSRIRGLGSRHSFNDLADSGELISLDAMPPEITIDGETRTVTCAAATRYGHLAAALEAGGWALHNMGSLPHISVAGATATATHGSGNTLKNLSSAISGLEFVGPEGDVRWVKRGEPDFDGSVVHLGALGIVTRVTLDIEPSFQVAQEVLERLPWEPLEAHFDEVFASAYSVSVFPNWIDHAGTLWLKHRLDDGVVPSKRATWGATRAPEHRHPMDQLTGDVCTPQRLSVGPWSERLPHFRMDRVPASGEEIQAEYMVARMHAPEVIRRFRAFEPELRDLLLVSEIRTVAADSLWLSTAYGRDTVCFHSSLRRDQAAVDELLPRLEALFDGFSPRPHWGKVFALSPYALQEAFPKLDDFRELAGRMDPAGKFRNTYLDRTIFA